MTTGRQFRAARVLLGISTAEEVAASVGLSLSGYQKIEGESVVPKLETVNKIIKEFSQRGVGFDGENGVFLLRDEYKVLTGKDCYLKLMDDVYYTLAPSNGEVLFLYVDDTVTTAEAAAVEKRLRSAGISFRNIISDKTRKIAGDSNEYRAIPDKFFNNELVVIYGDKIAQLINRGKMIIIINNQGYADMMRKTFEFIWHHGEKIS